MLRSVFRLRRAAGVVLLLSAPAAAAERPSSIADGHRHDTVFVACTSASAKACLFDILRARGGLIALKVPRGATATLTDVEIGKDVYLVTLDRTPPHSLALCRAMAADASPCRFGALAASIIDAPPRR